MNPLPRKTYLQQRQEKIRISMNRILDDGWRQVKRARGIPTATDKQIKELRQLEDSMTNYNQ